jgi:hypothetical protein
MRREYVLVFVYEALLNKLPSYLSSLINITIIIPKTRSQTWIPLEAHVISTELGMAAFSCYAPCQWKSLQTKLTFEALVPLLPILNIYWSILNFVLLVTFG